jgi:hypothetical protein
MSLKARTPVPTTISKASGANSVKEKAPPVSTSADALVVAVAVAVALADAPADALALAVELAVTLADISGQTPSGSKAV